MDNDNNNKQRSGPVPVVSDTPGRCTEAHLTDDGELHFIMEDRNGRHFKCVAYFLEEDDGEVIEKFIVVANNVEVARF